MPYTGRTHGVTPDMVDIEEDKQGLLREDHDSTYDFGRATASTKWIRRVAATAILLSLCLNGILIYLLAASQSDRRVEELDSPRIRVLQRQFTGGLKYDGYGNLFRDESHEGKKYVGNSSSIDQLWQAYDAVQNVELDPRQVNIPGLYTRDNGKVVTIPDVFHQLHCLIRMGLYDVNYHIEDDPKRHMHVDHCIDYIRQSIECRGDMTPLKLYYSESAKRTTVDFEGFHTCRDFDAIMDWAWHHHAKSLEGH